MRSIDADAIYDTLSDIFIEYLATSSNTDTRNALGSLYHTVLSAVETAPTVSPDEVRGVVHCGECKFWRRPPSCEGLARCETGETGIRYRTKNDFCSRGAKMEVTSDALS